MYAYMCCRGATQRCVGKMGAKMTTKQKAEFTHRMLLALLCAKAERDELDVTIGALVASLAKAHGIPASFPPVA
jgi:hypothetical protein